jgi:hypothetical protein
MLSWDVCGVVALANLAKDEIHVSKVSIIAELRAHVDGSGDDSYRLRPIISAAPTTWKPFHAARSRDATSRTLPTRTSACRHLQAWCDQAVPDERSCEGNKPGVSNQSITGVAVPVMHAALQHHLVGTPAHPSTATHCRVPKEIIDLHGNWAPTVGSATSQTNYLDAHAASRQQAALALGG